MTWKRGRNRVNELLASGHLDHIHGSAANGTALLTSSSRLLESAEREADINPEAAYALAYDSARKACSALLAQQGLRTRSAGHHLTTEEVVRAQFGGPFDAFGALRRRRSEIEYPRHPGEDVSTTEVWEAIANARAIHSAAESLIDQLSNYHSR